MLKDKFTMSAIVSVTSYLSASFNFISLLATPELNALNINSPDQSC